MTRSQSSRSSELDRYLARLDSELARLPALERQEILRETRSHTLERTRRAPFPAIDDVLAELGPPPDYARRFLPDAEASRSGQQGVIHRLASVATGRLVRLPLLFVVLGGYSIAFIAFAIAVWKIVEPDGTGLWVSDLADERRSIQFVVSDPRHTGREVLGYWLVPIGIGIAFAIHLLLSRLLTRVLRDGERERAE
jgi:hypothetical protein